MIRSTLLAVLLLCLVVPVVSAQTVVLTGKLVDRQCSVEDVYQLQATTAKRCTLYIEATFVCPAGVCKEVHTCYCPRKAADNRFLNAAYDVCSDPAGAQIGGSIIAHGWARTPAQRADGYGDHQCYQFQTGG